MLDSIRNSAQSFGVKMAFAIIILVFVFWGIGNFNDRDYSNVVAMVNGDPIVAQEFERAYMAAEEGILRNNPGITRKQLEEDHLGRQVLRDMIQSLLVQQEARQAGMTATPLELRTAVGKMEAFQNEQGKFDPEAYKRILENRRMSAADYEAHLGSDLTREKVIALITAPVWIDSADVKSRYDFMREARDVEYLFLPAADFLSAATVEDKAISDWYDANKNEFEVPATADVSYIVVRPENLVDPASFSEAEALAWYEANKSQFDTAEQVKARHILIPVAEDATEEAQNEAREKIGAAQTELEKGRSFAEVADEYNVAGAAGAGGELGWILRDQTVPAFEEALFSLEPGKISEPVRTQFGWHLIQAEEKKPGGIAPFSEVEADIRLNLAKDAGSDKLHDALDTLIEDNLLGKSLPDSAAKFGMQVERSGSLNQNALAEKLGIKPEEALSLLALPAGSPLETALEAGQDQYIIARVEAVTPASIQPLEAVRQEVADILKKEKAMELALAEGAAKLAKMADKSLLELQKEGVKLEKASGVAREGLVGNFLPDPELNAAIFETDPGKWLVKPFIGTRSDGQGALLVRVDKIVEPDGKEYEGIAELLDNAARRERMEALYNLFVQTLADKANIEITNQNIIDRTGR